MGVDSSPLREEGFERVLCQEKKRNSSRWFPFVKSGRNPGKNLLTKNPLGDKVLQLISLQGVFIHFKATLFREAILQFLIYLLSQWASILKEGIFMANS